MLYRLGRGGARSGNAHQGPSPVGQFARFVAYLYRKAQLLAPLGCTTKIQTAQGRVGDFKPLCRVRFRGLDRLCRECPCRDSSCTRIFGNKLIQKLFR